MLALSLKQPWAALLAHGLKTVEVRRWATEVRGRVLIHAARVPDDRPEAWAQVPGHLAAAARLGGGIVGQGDLVRCQHYLTREEFLRDRLAHLNAPSWYEPRLHGFHFENLSALPFRRVPGYVKFFDVPDEEVPAGVATRLLVSVRDAAEAGVALESGADLIDVKEPARGPLGRADDAVVEAVVAAVGGRVPVSAALGELRDGHPWRLPCLGLRYVKCGLAGCRDRPWRRTLLAARPVLPAELVFVAYADAGGAESPPVEEVCELAREQTGILLLDTFDKAPRDGRRPGLLDHLPVERLAPLVERLRGGGGRVALAGSLDDDAIRRLLPLRPDWIAVRGAACADADRSSSISAARVRELAALVRKPSDALAPVEQRLLH